MTNKIHRNYRFNNLILKLGWSLEHTANMLCMNYNHVRKIHSNHAKETRAIIKRLERFKQLQDIQQQINKLLTVNPD